MGARAKAKAVDCLGKVSILVLDEKWPMGYLGLSHGMQPTRNREGLTRVLSSLGTLQ